MGPPPGNSRQEQGRPASPAARHDPAAGLPVAARAAERWLSWIVLALILLALLIRVPQVVNWRLERDETEHLHAAWAVAHGQVPYRDFWQLHPPLLYYLMAPVLALMGEDLRVIYVGRGLMLLCILLILLQLYRIARACFDALTGLLAVLLLSYLLLYWSAAYEFRPDIPQTLLILMSLWRFMRAWERRSRVEFLASGALLGVACWFLIKTLFPLVGFTLVFGLSSGLRRSAAAIRENVTGLLLFLSAFAATVVLGGVLLWMAGALPEFLRWTVVGAFRWPERFAPFPRIYRTVMRHPEAHFVFWALALVGVNQTVTRMVRARVVDEVRLAPLLVGSVTAAVWLFLMPAPYAQSALPFLPLVAMYGADVVRQVVARALPPEAIGPAAGDAAVPVVPARAHPAWSALTALLLIVVCVPPLRVVLTWRPPLRDQWTGFRQVIGYVLALTSPGDSVLDSYGLYIFRPHATYYYSLSDAHLTWLRTGLIRETDIINDLLRSQCKVMIFSHWYMGRRSPTLLKFLRSHYVSTGFLDRRHLNVGVAGKALRPADLQANRATVSLVASAEYAVRVIGGAPKITIDGRLYQAPLFLTQGDHQLVVEGEFDSLAIFYSRVLAVPFPEPDRPPTDRSDRPARLTSPGRLPPDF